MLTFLTLWLMGLASCSSGGTTNTTATIEQVTISPLGQGNYSGQIAHGWEISEVPYSKLILATELVDGNRAFYYTNQASAADFELQQLLIPESYPNAKIWGYVMPSEHDLYLPVKQDKRILLMHYSLKNDYLGVAGIVGGTTEEEIKKIQAAVIHDNVFYFVKETANSGAVLCSLELNVEPRLPPDCDYGINFPANYNHMLLIKDEDENGNEITGKGLEKSERALYMLRENDGVYKWPLLMVYATANRQRVAKSHNPKLTSEGVNVLSREEALNYANSVGANLDPNSNISTFKISLADRPVVAFLNHPTGEVTFVAKSNNGRLVVKSASLYSGITQSEFITVLGNLSTSTEPEKLFANSSSRRVWSAFTVGNNSNSTTLK